MTPSPVTMGAGGIRRGFIVAVGTVVGGIWAGSAVTIENVAKGIYVGSTVAIEKGVGRSAGG